MRLSARRLLVPVVALVLLASGCADDGGGGGTSPDAGPGPDAVDGGGNELDLLPDADTGVPTDVPLDVEVDDDATVDPDSGSGESDADADGEGDATDGSGGPIDPNETPARRPPAEEVVTTCRTLTPPETGVCSVVSTGSEGIVLRGIVLTDTGRLEGGEVLVDKEGRITCVACDCSDSAGYASAPLVECAEGVISPGLINAHDHITYTQNSPGEWADERFDHRHDWRRGIREHTSIDPPGRATNDQMAWGELRQFMTGTTSMAGSGTGPGIMRNLDRSGDAQLGLGQPTVLYQTFPLDDGDALLRVDDCSYGSDRDRESVLASECYLPHVSEGIDAPARNEFLCLSDEARGGTDLMEPNTAMIHAIALNALDGLTVAQNSSKVIWSPRSNISLYGNTAPVTMYLNQGVRVGIGTDWTPSGSVVMNRELACAAYLNEVHYSGFFTSRELWLMATAWNAEALSINDAVGRLAPGLVADIAIFALEGAADPYEAIINADSGTAQMVMRGGQIRYGSPEFRGQSLTGSGTDLCDVVPVCGETRFVCIQDELGKNFASLQAANTGRYLLTFCDEVPAGEPTCEPFRPEEYDGVAENDRDGDGIADADDNCPGIFNPIRPMDGDAQSDVDGDGLGDVCDFCPTQGGVLDCGPIDPDDLDDDDIVNGSDNCPTAANAGQEDRDSDGIGDICDACPDAPNVGGAACPASIYDVKQVSIAIGTRVSVSGVVTALQGNRFFLQVADANRDLALGARFSGLFVFMPGTLPAGITLPRLGDSVTVSGRTARFAGQIQLSGVESITVTGSGSVPGPVIVDPALVATGAELADDYEAVLVSVEGVTVLSKNPTPVDSDPAPRNEYTVTGDLRVDDTIFNSFPTVSEGDELNVTGVLQFTYNHNRLLPRIADDVVFDPSAPPRLVSLTPSRLLLPEDEDDTTSDIVIQVRLNRAAPEGGIIVAMGTDESALATSDVTIPAGQTVGEVSWTTSLITEEAAAGYRDGTLTATLGDTVLSTPFRVYSTTRAPELTDVVLVSSVNYVGDVAVRANFDYPTPAASNLTWTSTDVAVVATGGSIGVPGALASFDFSLTALAIGETTLQFTYGGASVDVPLTVVEGTPRPCLIFSEYVEGSSNNKAIEIHNCGATPLELAGVFIDLQANERVDSSTNTQALTGTLAAGTTVSYCNGSAAAGLSSGCTGTSSVANFNGNDRLVLYREVNDETNFQLGEDEVLDMFGQWNVQPSGEPWANKTWRRCNSTEPYLGDVAFTLATFWREFPIDTFGDMGSVSGASCP
jgi:cytosine/adenosine deaminase-related metal-dependent hydrolase